MKWLFRYGGCAVLAVSLMSVCVLPVHAGAMDDEEYAVFAAVVGQWAEEVPGAQVIVRETTATREKLDMNAVDYLGKSAKIALDGGIAADFNGKNAVPQKLENRFASSLRVLLFSDEERNALFSGSRDGWKAFYEKYPRSGGYIEMSRPAFDRDHRVAILYFASHSDWLAARGDLLLLVKDGKGAWSIKARQMLWIS